MFNTLDICKATWKSILPKGHIVPLAVIGAIGFIISALVFAVVTLSIPGSGFFARRQILPAAAFVGFLVLFGTNLHYAKHYQDLSLTLRRPDTIDQLCRQWRPAWHHNSCLQQVRADNPALVGNNLLPSGVKVFLNGYNSFQWPV